MQNALVEVDTMQFGGLAVSRKRKGGRPPDNELNSRIVALYRAGKSSSEIGRDIGLNRRAVAVRLRRLVKRKRKATSAATPATPHGADVNSLFCNGDGYRLRCSGCGKPGPRKRVGRPRIAQLQAMDAAVKRGFADYAGLMWCPSCRPHAAAIMNKRQSEMRRTALIIQED